MARPRKHAAPAPEPKRPGRPRKVQPAEVKAAPDTDDGKLAGIVLDALAFLNTSKDPAEKVGYLGRCMEDLQAELGMRG